MIFFIVFEGFGFLLACQYLRNYYFNKRHVAQTFLNICCFILRIFYMFWFMMCIEHLLFCHFSNNLFFQLSMLKSRSVSVAENLKEEIGVIWDKLCVNAQHRDIFMMSHCDCHPKTIQSVSRSPQHHQQNT